MGLQRVRHDRATNTFHDLDYEVLNGFDKAMH